MAKTTEYGIGPETFPRGWFMIASSAELDKGPMALSYFDKDFALYRGESGNPVLLDAYCKHMGTHLTASTSAMIVRNGDQIEGDSIRCPYHGWRYGPDGAVDDIPYHDGPCPKSAAIQSYHVRESMGCVMMWFSPEGAEPDFEPPYMSEWDDPQWVQWEVADLGQLNIHNVEVLDNIADVRHLGPTHGQPCDYFENEIRDHLIIQRQGGYMQLFNSDLHTVTWYTGPGILLSKHFYAGTEAIEMIANIPVSDGVTQVWHGTLYKGTCSPASDEDKETAKQVDANTLEAFGTDFEIWKNKKSAVKVMQMKKDGKFNISRKWVSQFYNTAEGGEAIRQEVNGIHEIVDFPTADPKWLEYEKDLFS